MTGRKKSFVDRSRTSGKKGRRLSAAIQKIFFRILSMFIVLLLVVSCGQKPLPIRVGIVPWPGTEGLQLAKDLGYLKPELVNLIDYPSDPEMIRAYRNGDLQQS